VRAENDNEEITERAVSVALGRPAVLSFMRGFRWVRAGK
jgi:hypothetical protein